MKKLLAAALWLTIPLQAAAEVHEVIVGDNFFRPEFLTVQVGDTVRFLNGNGGMLHNVTWDNGDFPASVTATSFEYEVTFTEPGVYPYTCTIHPIVMTGMITVEGTASAPSLSIEKSANPATYSNIGDVIDYQYLVTNTGDVSIGGPITIEDDRATDESCPGGGIDIGAEKMCSASYTITQADIDSGSVTNTARACGEGPDGQVCSENDQATVNYVDPGPGPMSCDDADFTVENGVARVAAGPGDRTNDVQCAIEAADDLGLPTVRLANGSYDLSQIYVDRFEGSIEGTNRAQTVLNVMDGSIACQAQADEGVVPAAFKIVEGTTRVRQLTVNADDPCDSAYDGPFFLLHFSGQPDTDDCDNDVTFGSVDRVDLIGVTDAGQHLGAVAFAGEGAVLGGCKTTLLGTGKINRSTIQGFYTGVYLSLRASGQVDVNFNSLADNMVGVEIDNASQLLTIQENEFIRTEDFEAPFTGIWLNTSDPDGPGKNRLVVHRNIFDMAASSSTNSNAVLLRHLEAFPDLSFVATSNSFMGEDVSSHLGIVDIDDGIVANNDFSGTAERGISLSGVQTTVSGWSIVGNDLNGAFVSSEGDISFDANTADNLVGPGQDADIVDDGTNNTVLSEYDNDPR